MAELYCRKGLTHNGTPGYHGRSSVHVASAAREEGDRVIRIGTSGWSYASWRGVFYQPGLPQGQWLARYAEEFDTVELNASFYRWPGDAGFRRWHDRLPPGFALTVKAPRGLTHAKRLADPEAWLQRISRAWEQLGDRHGILLLQLPPGFERDDDRLEDFLRQLPRDVSAAVEFRHPSWQDEAVFAILEAHGAAYCVMDGAGLPTIPRATAEVVYVRFHGPDPDRLYVGSYSDDALERWAGQLREWEAEGRRVYAYFNNDEHGYAVLNARRLRELVES
ncbi:DUF72 domain-containing protein [Agromyces salentinus]|uniref:DUF72 domain-containing protein n=1 Tax=Agromyces salentinus TaxID=269421 RepID=A0ABN2MP05_9MICO|nr:DUF72 domain-containing protein [Agromyces salentinus]